MALSESAEKGRTAALTAALFCGISAVLSLLTLNIPLALIGFWTAGGIRKGNPAARNVDILLRIADMPVMLIIWLAVRAVGAPELLITVLAVTAGLMAFIDIWSLTALVGNKNLKQYFRETAAAETNRADRSD